MSAALGQPTALALSHSSGPGWGAPVRLGMRVRRTAGGRTPFKQSLHHLDVAARRRQIKRGLPSGSLRQCTGIKYIACRSPSLPFNTDIASTGVGRWSSDGLVTPYACMQSHKNQISRVRRGGWAGASLLVVDISFALHKSLDHLYATQARLCPTPARNAQLIERSVRARCRASTKSEGAVTARTARVRGVSSASTVLGSAPEARRSAQRARKPDTLNANASVH